MRMIGTFLLILVTSLHARATIANSDEGAAPASHTGFLVAVPDRGFAGNETVRDAFVPMASCCNAELVFVTDERSRSYIEQAVERLQNADARELVVLPLFISTAHPRFDLLRTLLDQVWDQRLPLLYSRAFGESYLAVEMLVQRIRDAQVPGSSTVVLAGYGARDESSASAMSADLDRIAALAAPDAGMDRISPLVWPARGTSRSEALENAAWQQVKDASVSADGVTIVSFHLGRRLDSMMSFDAYLDHERPQETGFAPTGDGEGLFFSLWMQREANRYLISKSGRPGVVFLAHGADFHWNQMMRDSVQSLAEKFPMEFAFSMADPPSIRRAVERLESRGVAAIVIVRVFGMPDSFRTTVERLIGADVESGQVPSESADGPHHNSGMRLATPRLRTTTMVTTTGGLGDHPLFARALLDRAEALSRDAAQETVILVAHGQGSEEANQRWIAVLGSLAKQMKSMGGEVFRDIRFQTWREDWADKRDPSIDAVRAMVKVAQEDGGSAIVVAARTTGTGPTETFLDGLGYRSAQGFAPHPLFSQWVETQIESGISVIRESVWNSLRYSTDHRRGKLDDDHLLNVSHSVAGDH